MKQETAGPDWTALARYLAGESSPAEAEEIRRWLAESPGRSAVYADLERATRLAAPASGQSIDVEATLKRVKARFHEAEVVPLADSRDRRRWWTSGLAAAAALLLLVSAGLLWRAIRTGDAPFEAATYVTGVGRTDSIPLPDGSHIKLGPNSQVTVAAGYGDPARVIALQGEAFFDVMHDEERPFSVQAGGALVQDLGTRFSVRTDSEGVRVVVESGSVRVQDTVRTGTRAMTLRAGEAGILEPDRRAPMRQQPRTAEDLAWLNGQLIFEHASMTRVRDDLRRWYGAELVFADSVLLTRHISARFAGERLDQVLRALALTLGATIERRGDTAIVRSRRP